MKTFPLVISTPHGEFFRDSVVKISLRGVEGDLAIMAGHIPFITAVKSCDCSIELQDGNVKTGITDGGIISVTDDSVTLLSGIFSWK